MATPQESIESEVVDKGPQGFNSEIYESSESESPKRHENIMAEGPKYFPSIFVEELQ